ncbi:LuxR family transcriptional regulator [Serratia ficaria]|uniref:Transcriptional activator protein lasR n=1 Tax=Serratia ficaria TaxID=61651 RepID=A0A240A6Z3_SERFI|nr:MULTISPECIES: LuxR family transcriptional regulator [Serratia]MEE4483490.1 LuxR family transcriptional regulator [Serratia ficaria]REF42587.1 LuxR family quorum-sensing system transcriptional regulator ExpR [Serratia ficaria]CAI0909618.1 Transcriptional activator protein lasR [Serratia ficaria]CAI0915641.1 Transcriptional activator protein lasR [Serratia ficaria]CAI1075898.1 Transcriptional activator protein lasR [Serratia ficaria]
MSNLFFNDENINASIKKHLEATLSEYKNIKYAYAIMNKRNPANFSIISNRTEWFEFYIKNNYQFIDPVLITASHRITPFTWDKDLKIGSGLKLPKIFDMGKNYNVINGYTFVLHDHNHNLVVLSIMLDKHCDDDIEEQLEKNKDKIQMLLITTHEELTANYQNVNTPADFERMNQREFFSKRENEIIYWASVGKSYQEIALILGIKLTTVKYHIGNAVKKLGVTNAKHAIRLGVELQLIRPLPADGE